MIDKRARLDHFRASARDQFYQHPFEITPARIQDDTMKAIISAHKLAKQLKIDTKVVTAPCDYAGATFGGPREWLADTGSGFDLVGRQDVPAVILENLVEPATTPLKLSTANGIIKATDVVLLQCTALD